MGVGRSSFSGTRRSGRGPLRGGCPLNGRPAPISDAERHTQESRRRKGNDRESVGCVGTELDSGHFANQQLDVRGWITEAQACADPPMPVRARAVSPSEPQAETKPGQRSERHGPHLPRPRASPHPAQAVECDPGRVEHEESDIERLIHPTDCAFSHRIVNRQRGWRSGAQLMRPISCAHQLSLSSESCRRSPTCSSPERIAPHAGLRLASQASLGAYLISRRIARAECRRASGPRWNHRSSRPVAYVQHTHRRPARVDTVSARPR